MRIPRAACINDLSGFGRCSLTTAISVISAAGVQVCPLPTAILSKHTGFPGFYFSDFTDSMSPYIDNWNDVEFDGIYSGFLGSSKQINIVENFIEFRKKGSVPPKIIIDPVMGDNGRLYPTYTEEMKDKISILVSHADLATPNITEACFMTGTPYTGENISDNKAEELCRKIFDSGCKNIVLTGIVRENNIINFSFDGNSFFMDKICRESRIYSGTGDIFASVVCGLMLKGIGIPECVKAAGKFISEAIRNTTEMNAAIKEGVVFEPLLYKLSEYR